VAVTASKILPQSEGTRFVVTRVVATSVRLEMRAIGGPGLAMTQSNRPVFTKGWDLGSKTTWHRLVIFKEAANVENTLEWFGNYIPSIPLNHQRRNFGGI